MYILLPILLITTIVAVLMPEDKIRGVNLLQSRTVPMTDIKTGISLKRLKSIGVNTIAVIPFLEQASTNSPTIVVSLVMTEDQLLSAIRQAKRESFRTILKPQILLKDGWHGDVVFMNDADWQEWFANYQRLIVAYAKLAERESVDIFVVGTELKKTTHRDEWSALIANVREHYSGEISYAAHNLSGFRAVKFWQLLDSASLTMYPALSKDDDLAEAETVILKMVDELRQETSILNMPVWVAEVGIPSYQGATAKPWAWRHLNDVGLVQDQDMQSHIVEIWIKALTQKWNKGVLLWSWFNDPEAGGIGDTGYTIQNKKAEAVVKCLWKDDCDVNV